MNILNTKLGRINYVVKHQPKKPYIFFIGGLGSTISSWEEQIASYKNDFSTLAFDNLGAGKSSNPNKSLTMKDYAENCFEISQKLNLKSFYVVGKSMGGMIAQVFAAKYPKSVKKLILACTCGTRDKVSKEIIQVAKKIATKVGMKEIWFNALLLGYSREYIYKNFPKYKRTVFQNSVKDIEGYLEQCKAIEALDNVKYLKKIKCETLIIYGKNDLIVPPYKSNEMASFIKNSQVIGFPGGHGFWKENKNLVDPEVLEFLIN